MYFLETINGMKIKLNILMFMTLVLTSNYVLHCRWSLTFVAVAINSSYRLTMGKNVIFTVSQRIFRISVYRHLS